MFEKYKQAVNCLQRSERINKENEIRYQTFLDDLKNKGAKNSPQKMEEKLYYMERLINTQNQLLESQRQEFEGTIVKEV